VSSWPWGPDDGVDDPMGPLPSELQNANTRERSPFWNPITHMTSADFNVDGYRARWAHFCNTDVVGEAWDGRNNALFSDEGPIRGPTRATWQESIPLEPGVTLSWSHGRDDADQVLSAYASYGEAYALEQALQGNTLSADVRGQIRECLGLHGPYSYWLDPWCGEGRTTRDWWRATWEKLGLALGADNVGD